MISIVDVTKSYRLGARRFTALCDVSLEVQRGDFVVIIGSSGAGKSTLLGVLGGLLRPSRGQVLMDGLSLWDISEGARAQFRTNRIGFVFQSASVIGVLTVLENVMLPRMLAGRVDAEARTKAAALLESFGLGGKIDTFPEQLSGGEKRRVAVASALMNDPSVLIADEPTGDLDPRAERLLMEHFVRQNRMGTTVIMVTHNHGLARYANRLFHMEAGRLVEHRPDAAIPGAFTAQPVGVEECRS